MLGLLFAGEGLVPSAKVPLRTQQALGPLKARAVTTEMSALRTAAIIGVSASSCDSPSEFPFAHRCTHHPPCDSPS